MYGNLVDLREDKYYLAEHPGMVAVTSEQVKFLTLLAII